MMYNKQLDHAVQLIQLFDFTVPLHRYLKAYFKQNRQMGSRDRKTISSLIFGYFRLGKSTSKIALHEAVIIGQLFSEEPVLPLLASLKPDWSTNLDLKLEAKFDFILSLYPDFDKESIFPLIQSVSEHINPKELFTSVLTSNRVFIRVRPNKTDVVLSILNKTDVTYTLENQNCFSFDSGVKLESIFPYQPEKLYQIQDINSQKVATICNPQPKQIWWDACAGSGGKSIALVDEEPSIQLIVSDYRTSILQNLENRFKESGIERYSLHTLDLLKPLPHDINIVKFDGILLDVPCSGSGTWARSPEFLISFTHNKLLEYVDIQRSILKNICKQLSKGKVLVYSTCSVYTPENEQNVDWFCKEFGYKLMEQYVLNGTTIRADSMFVAKMVKK